MKVQYPQLFDTSKNFEDEIFFKGERIIILRIIP